jgi:hypothetical protein
MSRSGYIDECDGWDLIRWRGAVAQAIRGHRGQAFLRDLLAALEAMPDKRLVANSFSTEGGAYCTLGVIGAARGVELPDIDGMDPDDIDPFEVRHEAASALNIADALAAEIMFENDEGSWHNETPEQRWERMHKWVSKQIKEAA